MFSKIALLATASLAIFAAASPVPEGGNTCSTGPVQCCNTVQSAQSAQAAGVISGLVAVLASALTGQVGATCSPISVIGAGGNSCSGQTVCCSNNNFNGVVALGCTPINIGL